MGSIDDAALAPALDHETRLQAHDHTALKLWLRLLTCTNLIEGSVRRKLRSEFESTLPRFDLLAQLERHPQGLKMSELSQRLMVTGGNVTGLVAQLVDEGLVDRSAVPHDRRAHVVRLTARGRETFGAMAIAHERWIVDMIEDLGTADRDRLHGLLGRLKAAVRSCEPDANVGAEADA